MGKLLPLFFFFIYIKDLKNGNGFLTHDFFSYLKNTKGCLDIYIKACLIKCINKKEESKCVSTEEGI